MRALHPVLAGALLTLLTCLPGPGHGESYFGDSFCHLQAVQDVSTFQLSLQIKTSRRSGLLLLAAGMEDYVFLELLNGKLQARMNLGTGEVKLSSSQGVQLNNLVLHKVLLTLQDGQLTMTIDDLYPTYVPVDDDGEKLNIDRGVWLGGTGDLDAPYLSNAIPPFRGCMSEIKFVSHQFDILASVFRDCHDTREKCSEEFEAADGEAISFSTPDSFVSFPTWSGPAGASRTLEFLMKTTIEDALLVFHHGQESDFIAIGITKGHLKGILDLGAGMQELENTQVMLDDDQWHRVKVQLNPDSFTLNIDSQASSIPLDSSEKLDLIGNLYIGGIQGKMKQVFHDSGSLGRFDESMTSESFIGCLGEIRINLKHRSLQDALVTKDVHIKCEGDDYDYSAYYDETTATTTPPTVHILYTDPKLNDQDCYPTDDWPEIFRNVTKFLDITPLFVPDGGEAFLDIYNLHPTFDLAAAGMRQSQVIFTLESDPWYGLIDINVSRRQVNKFTLLDVVNNKVKYMHDGNERQGDQIQFEVVAQSNGYLPECLKTPQKYTLPVMIVPAQDPPQDPPQVWGEEILIAEKGRTRMGPSLIKVLYSGLSCEQLVVTVTVEPSVNFGYLENDEQPGRSISEFTCSELRDGNIYFVHREGGSGEITVKVSDGQSVIQSGKFELLVKQQHKVITSTTGLTLIQGGNVSIGVQNLYVPFHTPDGDIVYNVTQPPMFGQLKIKTSNGMYEEVTSFHQSHLDQGLIRYFSTDLSNQEDIVKDELQFNVRLGQISHLNCSLFVTISPAPVKVSNLIPLTIRPGEKTIIGLTMLQADVMNKRLNPQAIKYILVSAPSLGSLQRFDEELVEGDVFTQKDISDNAISYRVQTAGDNFDQFEFRVFADGEYSPLYAFPISISAGLDNDVLTIKELVVLQGGEQTLNKNYLWLQSPSSTEFLYQVRQGPKHGRLIRDSPPGEPRFDEAIRIFSNEDLQLNRLIYKHDGSKTSSDEFHFSATDQSSNTSETVSGIFRILIQSKNEHAPVRIVDKVLNVVRHGQRLLTTDVIKFKDDDSGFNDTQIVYARDRIFSGSIVSASNPQQPLFRFTQDDLRDKKILFIHQGADWAQFVLQVSDGFHKTTSLLEIQAGKPYLHVVNNAVINIDHGSTKTLDTSLLSADSNMDIRDDREIKFQITSPPSDGRIIVSGIEALEFTQEDLKKGVVSYEHNYESLRSKDSFGFTVKAKGHSEEGIFKIKILRQGYLSGPEAITNEVIISYEGEHTIISQDHLKAEQENILPSEMMFTVKMPPRLGHVVMLKNSSDDPASPVLDYIHSFSQEDIDQGHILYVSSSIQGYDSFTVDVSNGFSTVEDLHVTVNIVPRFIPLQTSNFTVKEGLSRAINEEVVNISHPFYRSAIVHFFVEENPQHGELRNLKGDEITDFSWDEVKLGQVVYIHDSSETTEDSFTLAASAYELERRSEPVAISVTILPVNDEPPTLTSNTGLEVLAGEEADITSSMLSTEDADTPAEELVYHVEMPANGRVALREEPEESILNFTQAHINKGEVIFVHKGDESGGFSFTVTDGEHTSPLYRFAVTARPLTITMVTKEELVVFPGTRQPITSANLGAKTSEDGNEISFLLVRPPRFGRLLVANGENQYEERTLFSQSQLESGSVFYEHQLPAKPFWVVRDTMEFALSSQPAPDVRHVLPVTVSYYAAHSNVSSQLWRNGGLEIVQGQSKTIDSSVLDASNLLASVPEAKRANVDVLFEIRRFPKHGRLTLNGEDLPRSAPTFAQQDVSAGKLDYLHDDSGVASDIFSFRARLKPEGGGTSSPAESVVLEEVFHISVKQRGSHPPEVVTTDMLLEVLQGSTTVLTQNHLNTHDEDSPPDEVHFELTKAPGNGKLVDPITLEPISEFTQEMVNRGQVGFNSDGSLKEGFLEFVVSDGEHQTEPFTLHIGVLARKLILNKVAEIKVRQGDDQTLLTEEMLKATTGGPVEEDILYKITSAPEFAAIMVDRQPTSAFTQKQIKEGRVSVRFVRSTSPRDSISFTARSRAANVSSVLNVTVQPLARIAQGPLLPWGTLVQLDRKLLDATPLANKTKASAWFRVIRRPKGARFVTSGSPGAGQPVDLFSQKDLDEGRMAMEILDVAAGSRGGGNQDEALFLLEAHGVPPAECVLSFKTGPYNASGVYPATLLRTPYNKGQDPGTSTDWPVKNILTTASPGSSSHGNPHVSRRSNFWSIFIPVLIVLCLLLVAAVLAYYLIRKNKTGKHDVQTAAASKPKNGEVAATETFRKTDPANNIPLTSVDSKDADPELLQHCRTTNPALKKNQYWV